MSGLSRHVDHHLVQEVVNSNPAIARKFINLFKSLFDLFIYFSHLLVTKTSPLCRGKMMSKKKPTGMRKFDSKLIKLVTPSLERHGEKKIK